MEKIHDSGNRVPITILTGFLGAGKTTLLNRILTADHGLRVGVLVNDFGAIDIDAELVVGATDNMISLANGCVCCQIRDDLVESVVALLARPEAVEYVLLETSGVADPAGIFMTFNDANLHDRIRLDSVTCVIDAAQVVAHPEYPPLMELKLRQVGFADMLVLNKVGLAGPAQVAKVRAWLDEHFNRLRIVETDYCAVPNAVLLGVGCFDPARASPNARADEHGCPDAAGHGSSHGHDHSDVFSTWSYETDQPLSLAKLRDVMRRLPGTIYRAKGVVYSTDAPERRTPRTQIVAIGAAGGIDANLLGHAVASCIPTAGAAAQ